MPVSTKMFKIWQIFYWYLLNCRLAFFATWQGKSACDGIGGTIKRLIDNAIKQDHFLIKITDILNHIVEYIIEDRYNKCSKLKGIRPIIALGL